MSWIEHFKFSLLLKMQEKDLNSTIHLKIDNSLSSKINIVSMFNSVDGNMTKTEAWLEKHKEEILDVMKEDFINLNFPLTLAFNYNQLNGIFLGYWLDVELKELSPDMDGLIYSYIFTDDEERQRINNLSESQYKNLIKSLMSKVGFMFDFNLSTKHDRYYYLKVHDMDEMQKALRETYAILDCEIGLVDRSNPTTFFENA